MSLDVGVWDTMKSRGGKSRPRPGKLPTERAAGKAAQASCPPRPPQSPCLWLSGREGPGGLGAVGFLRKMYKKLLKGLSWL